MAPVGLEDRTVDFKVGTLNDLLERTRPGTTTAAESSKYKTLAIGNGAVAALLAIALVVVMLTGGGGKDEAPKAETDEVASVKVPAGLLSVPVPINAANVGDGVEAGKTASFLGEDGAVVVRNALIVSIRRTDTDLGSMAQINIAVPPGDVAKVKAMNRNKTLVVAGDVPEATPATQPAPAPPEAPPVEPAPATPPPS